MGKQVFNRVLLGVIASVFIIGCSSQAPNTVEGIDNLYNRYRDGNKKALVNLTDILNDQGTPTDVRMHALKTILNSNDPNGLTAIRKAIETDALTDHNLFMAAVKGLNDVPGQKNVTIVMKALETARKNYSADRDEMLRLIEDQADNRSVAGLLAIYSHSEEDFQKFEATMTRVLGKMDDQRVIPILMAVASDRRVPLDIRNKAIELLGRKNDPAVGKLLAQLLQDPGSQNEIRDFALASTDELKDGRVILALVEALHGERSAYFTMVDAITRGLENYTDPAIKPVLLSVAMDDMFPLRLRR